jgi:hypothetical protein
VVINLRFEMAGQDVSVTPDQENGSPGKLMAEHADPYVVVHRVRRGFDELDDTVHAASYAYGVIMGLLEVDSSRLEIRA